jgi:F420-dependent NADP oxidoreductase-like protein
MRKVAILGGGQSGLQLALGLLQNQYEVTVVSNRTPEKILSGRVSSSQFMFHDSLQNERDLGINGILTGRVPPIVRKPVCQLPSGGLALGMGELVATNNPITGQGANTASKAAKLHVLRAGGYRCSSQLALIFPLVRLHSNVSVGGVDASRSRVPAHIVLYLFKQMKRMGLVSKTSPTSEPELYQECTVSRSKKMLSPTESG